MLAFLSWAHFKIFLKNKFMPERKYLTPEGFLKLKEKLEYLKKEKRKEIAARIRAAKELGDLSENAEYQDAKDEQAFNEGKIFELANIVKSAIVVQKNNRHDIVAVGNTVKVKKDSKEREFMIVGSNEADPLVGRISNESPIGRALLGKRKGDAVEVETPAGTSKYEILSIS